MSDFNKNEFNNINNKPFSHESIFSKSTPPKFTNIYKIYKLFLLASFILHVILGVIFFYCSFHYWAVYNIISSVIYIISLNTFKLKRMNLIFTIVNIELLFFICSSIIFIGYNYGFYLYYLLVIQLILYSSISIKTNKYNLKNALLQFAIITALLLIAFVYTINNAPIYKVKSANTSLFELIYILNFLFIAAMTFLLNYSFLADVNISTNRLASTNDELSHIATHDPLTNLLNRRSMNEQFYLAIENYKNNREPFSLILGDIDDFKKVNDVYGHDSGDIVLKRVAKTITSIVPKSSSVCRWGGEEMLILVYGDINQAVTIAEQIREAVAATSFTFNNNYIHSTLTLGVAQYNPSYPIGKIVSIADENLYKGKSGTKNCVVA